MSSVSLFLLFTVVFFTLVSAESRLVGANTHDSSGETPSLTSACEYDFKVYVYPLPPSLPSVFLAEQARHNSSFHVCVGCIYEQFALEYIMQDFFTQFCGRTQDPSEADFFYLPIIRDAEFRVTKLKNNNKKPSLTEIALLRAMEKNDTRKWRDVFRVTDQYWLRHGGADHIIGETEQIGITLTHCVSPNFFVSLL